MRYYTDASLAANILDPPDSRGGDLEIEGEVSVLVIKICRDTALRARK